jgi:acetoacetate decarboxylase
MEILKGKGAMLEGRQHLWDMTLNDGEVVYDYLEAERS